MRRSILLLALSAAVLGGCTSAYKTGQTPDDVYYSPERQRDEYVRVKETDDRRYQGDADYYDDRYLHMKVHNRVMWSDLDDYYFYNPRYSYSYYNTLNWSNPWSPYTYWNYHYNPYCSHPVIYSTGYAKATYNHPRMFNLNTYNNTQLTNNNYTNPKASIYNNNYSNNNRPLRVVGTNSNSNSSNYNSNSNAGSFLRNIFNGSSNSSSNNNSSPSSSTRSSSSNSNSSSSSGSGGGGGGTAPVRKF